MARFKQRGSGVELRATAAEVRALQRLLEDFLQLLDDDVADRVQGGGGEPDPLEALVGIASEPVAPPADPAVARIFPDAYGGNDEQRTSDYRRYHESDLREGKRDSVRTVQGVLTEVKDGGKALLDDDQVSALLGSLNDLRLVLGARLDVGDDYVAQVKALPPGDPQLQAFAVYEALTALQDGLLQTLLR